MSDAATAEAMLIQPSAEHRTKVPVHTTVTLGDAGSETNLSSTSSRLRTSRKRLLVLTFILLASTFIILLAVTYLTFMWLGGRRRSLWKLVILSEWITTTVAICGVTIRWMSGIQMILCTSILALELLRSGTLLQDIPRLSTMRYNNSGPLDLVYATLGWPRKAFHLHTFILVLLSSLTVTLLQFTSTLFVSDLGNAPIETFAGQVNTSVFPPGGDWDPGISLGDYNDVLLTTAPTYPLFAESSHEFISASDDSIDDTGPVIRAMIPVSTEAQRSKLRSYKGNATLFDARWVCTRPPLRQPYITTQIFDGSGQSINISGQLDMTSVPLPMVSSNTLWTFNCTIPWTFHTENQRLYENRQPWLISSCPIGRTFESLDNQMGTSYNTYGQALVNALETVYDSVHNMTGRNLSLYMPYDNSTSQGYDMAEHMPFGTSYLVINATDVSLPHSNATFGWPTNSTFGNSSAWNTSHLGPWTRLSTTKRHLTYRHAISTDATSLDVPFILDISLCSDGMSWTKNAYIEASRETFTEEPINMTDGVAQIGATTVWTSLDSRGIMSIDSVLLREQLAQEAAAIVENQLDGPVLPVSDRLRLKGGTGLSGLILKQRRWFPDYDMYLLSGTVNTERMRLFQSVLQDTGSPAKAMQSWMHTIMTDRYYAWLPYFTNETMYETTYSVDRVQPTGTTGFVIIMSGIFIHLALVVYICITFGILRGVQEIINSTDQAWQVHAQIATLQDTVTRREASMTTATDHEVEKSLRHRGLKGKIFILDEIDDLGTRGFVLKKEE